MERSRRLQHQPYPDPDVALDAGQLDKQLAEPYTNLWGDDPWPALESNWSQPSKQIMARLTSTIGTTMVNDLEFAYSNNRINITPGGTDPALLPATTAAIPPQWPLSFKTFPVGIPTIWGGFGAYGNGQN